MKTKNTLLKKIITLFAILLVPILLVGFISLSFGNMYLRKQVLSSIENTNTSYISHLDNSLYTTYKTCFNTANLSNLQRFATSFSSLSIYDQAFQVKLLRDQLSTLRLSLPFCESAHAFFRDLQVIYHSSGYELGSFSTLSKEDFDALKSLTEHTGILHSYTNPQSEKSELAFILMPSPSSNYGVTFTLSQSELSRYVTDNITYDGELYYFLAGEDFMLTNVEKPEDTSYKTYMKERMDEAQMFSGYPVVTISGKTYYAFSNELPNSSFEYIRLIPTEAILNSTNTLSIFMLIFLLVLSVICVVFFIGVYRMIHKPLYQLTTAFEEVENGNFSVRIDPQQNSDFSYLFCAFNDMTEKLHRLIEQDYNQKMLLQKAELKQLQAQINPHFLYNSFFMLQRMIKTEMTEESQEMANALGKYFRYLTRNSMDNVTLETEYEHAKTYAYIQGLRFAGRIEVQFEDLPVDFKDLPVPKLILQPLLENAFNYGLNNKMEGGILKVHFTHAGNSLTIIVEDNGDELSDEILNTLTDKLKNTRETSAGSEMTGLLNIQRRLSIFSDYSYSLDVCRSSMGGLCVTICLKK